MVEWIHGLDRRLEGEWMDQPGLDIERLHQALSGLARLNRWSRSASILWPALAGYAAARGLRAMRVPDLGDAAAYVEPFTGEGMAWALAQGQAVAPVAETGARAWSASCGRQWREVYTGLMTQRQRRCRAMAGALRYPRAVGWALSVLTLFPWAASWIVNRFTLERR